MPTVRYSMKYEELTNERRHGNFYCHECGKQVPVGVFHVHNLAAVVDRHLSLESDELTRVLSTSQ